MTPLRFAWNHIAFFQEGDVPWTPEDALTFARRVEEIAFCEHAVVVSECCVLCHQPQPERAS